jgi:Uma2 family endonuclease
MSIEAFEAWAERQDGRFELVRGKPMMMNQTTRYHSRITKNIILALGNAVDDRQFDVAAGDFALQTGDDTLRLADIMVTPAEGSGKDRRTNEAVLLVEVLSPSTATDDFGDKQREYLALSSLHAYLIVAQDAVCVWAWIRGDDGFPKKPEVIEMRDGAVTLPVLGVTVTLETIYRNVEL